MHDDWDDTPDAECGCVICEWKGTRGQTEKRWYESGGNSWQMLAGRRGWQWHCPECDFAIHSHWYMMS